ncbi:peptidase U32 [Minicystis rosea]|nr:peptidase U32 [Minicystis rosea]
MIVLARASWATFAPMERALRRPEILAPAGDAAAMRAAVRAGADAVYFGLVGFNARARATNFDAAELGETMRFLHEHGVRGYVTLNTLVFDDELPSVEAAVRTCAAAGVDAVIVQDLGVARVVRALAPDLPIHASTQMTCTDAASVELARAAGASRVILARELSLAEIAAIRAQTDVEVEVFVHGALCIAYSGQCLTSEAIGGRSANRGACAQACRLPYELLIDGEKRDLGDAAYLLSPEDLEASALVPELMKIGVSSLKIEGRLKGPEYVAATTALYRKAALAAAGEGDAPTEDDRRAALQMFSRGSGPGFLGGVDHQRLVEGRACDHRGVQVATLSGVTRMRGKPHLVVRAEAEIARGDGILVEGGFAGEGEIGGRVWGITVRGENVERVSAGREALIWLGPDKHLDDAPQGRRVWKTNDPAREKEIQGRVDRDPHRVAIDVHVSGRFGESFELKAISARGATASVKGDAPVETARSAPLSADVLRDKLGRLGDTPFTLGALTLDLPDGALIPMSSLNRARRALVDALLVASARAWPTTTVSHRELVAAAVVPDRAPPPPGLFVLCRTLPQAEAAVAAGADGVYLDFLELTGTGAAVRALRARGPVHITVAPPRIRKPGEEKIDRYLASLDPDAILVRSLGALHELQSAPDGIPRIGDFSLNVTNRLTAAEVLGRGLAAFTPSFDLDAAQLLGLLSSPFAPFAEVVVHHPMPLFHMEHCVIAALLSDGHDYKSCGRPCDRHQISLRDRAGMEHPVEADVGCRNTVFHASPQSAAGLVSGLGERGVRRHRIELVREKPEDVTRIVRAYRDLIEGRVAAGEVWRTLKTDSNYGVVKGSLRVLST